MKPNPPNNGPGYLEVGINEQKEIVINLPRDMTGHIIFSLKEAFDLSVVLQEKALEIMFCKWLTCTNYDHLCKQIIEISNREDLELACERLWFWQLNNTDSFTDRIFTLFQKADKENYLKLAIGFPEECYAYQLWYHAPNQDEFFKRFCGAKNE